MNLLKSRIVQGIILLSTLCGMSQSVEGEVASVKAMGMGWVGVAYPQDALAGAYNPAGTVWVGDRFDIGFTAKRYNGESRVSGNITIGENEPINGRFNAFNRKNFFTGDAGYNYVMNVFGTNLAMGVVAFERNFFHPSFKTPFFVFGRTNLELEYINYVVAPVVAVQIQNHSIGASFNFNTTHFKVRGAEVFRLISAHPGHVTNNGGDNSWGLGVTLGWQWRITDCFTIGVTFQPETPIKKHVRYTGFLAEHGKLNVPQIVAAGISVKPCDQMTVALDIENKSWNKIKSMRNKLQPAITDALLGDATHLFGAEAGPGFGWRSQTSIRVGIDWRFNECFTVRAGYRFRNTPVRSTETFLNQMTMETISNFATFGLTWSIGCGELSFYYAHGFEGRVNGDKNDSIPNFFGAGKVSLSSHLNMVGIGWGWLF